MIGSYLRRVVPLVAALTASIIAAQPVAAYTVVNSNSPGQYLVLDSSTQPSVRCVIDGHPPSDPTPDEIGLVKIKVYPPKMWGKANASTASWQFVIRRTLWYPPNSNWANVYTSSFQSDTATTATAANSFSPRTWNVPQNSHPDAIFTVRINMVWKNNANTVLGNALLQLKYYRETGPYGSNEVDQLPCYFITGQA